jgi:hypothetical protein
MTDPEQPTLFDVLAFEIDKAVAALREHTLAKARPAAPAPVPEQEPAAEQPRRWDSRRWRTPAGLTGRQRLGALSARLSAAPREPEAPADVKLYAPIYQLKVTLKGIRPPIWRRLLVPSNVTLARLHRIIQNAVGWENYHLYSFTIDDDAYSEGEDLYFSGFLDARGRRLFEIDLIPGSRLGYIYDFGDGWQHTVELEKVVPADPTTRYPICVTGARACPPEDCGGTWGYGDFLKAISDPKHEQHEEMLQWVGRPFDRHWFNLLLANLRLLQTLPHEAKSERDRRLAWKAMALISPPSKKKSVRAGPGRVAPSGTPG